ETVGRGQVDDHVRLLPPLLRGHVVLVPVPGTEPRQVHNVARQQDGAVQVDHRGFRLPGRGPAAPAGAVALQHFRGARVDFPRPAVVLVGKAAIVPAGRT